jgi:hypothetical protein
MSSFLIGALIYTVVGASFFCYCVICDSILAKSGLQPRIPFKGWSNYHFYGFISAFWVFVAIFLIHREYK